MPSYSSSPFSLSFGDFLINFCPPSFFLVHWFWDIINVFYLVLKNHSWEKITGGNILSRYHDTQHDIAICIPISRYVSRYWNKYRDIAKIGKLTNSIPLLVPLATTIYSCGCSALILWIFWIWINIYSMTKITTHPCLFGF